MRGNLSFARGEPRGQQTVHFEGRFGVHGVEGLEILAEDPFDHGEDLRIDNQRLTHIKAPGERRLVDVLVCVTTANWHTAEWKTAADKKCVLVNYSAKSL